MFKKTNFHCGKFPWKMHQLFLLSCMEIGGFSDGAHIPWWLFRSPAFSMAPCVWVCAWIIGRSPWRTRQKASKVVNGKAGVGGTPDRTASVTKWLPFIATPRTAGKCNLRPANTRAPTLEERVYAVCATHTRNHLSAGPQRSLSHSCSHSVHLRTWPLSLSLFLTSSCYPVIVEYKGMSLAMVYSLRNMAYVPMGFELERISLDVCQLEFPCYVV